MDFRVYLEPTRATACSTIRAQLGGACATIISSLFSSCLCFISDSTHSLPLLHKGCFALFHLPRVWSFLFLFFFCKRREGNFRGVHFYLFVLCINQFSFLLFFPVSVSLFAFFFFFFTWFFCFSFSFNEFDLGLGWASELLESHHCFFCLCLFNSLFVLASLVCTTFCFTCLFFVIFFFFF